jgi:hypothetical protein
VTKRGRELAKKKNLSGRYAVTGDIRGFSISNSKATMAREQGLASMEFPGRAIYMVGLHPSMPYCPIPRLVALFARGATCAGNPRAPRTQPGASTGFLYAVVLKAPMERVNFHDNGNRGGFHHRFGGSAAGQGSDQGAMFGRGGFPLATGRFHPGHVGRGPHLGVVFKKPVDTKKSTPLIPSVFEKTGRIR